MLTTNITLAEKYDYLSDKFKKAFTFLRETDLASLPVGRTEIDGDEVYASVQSYTTMTVEECAFESHLEYFDVQYVVEGEECFAYEPRPMEQTLQDMTAWLLSREKRTAGGN